MTDKNRKARKGRGLCSHEGPEHSAALGGTDQLGNPQTTVTPLFELSLSLLPIDPCHYQ